VPHGALLQVADGEWISGIDEDFSSRRKFRSGTLCRLSGTHLRT